MTVRSRLHTAATAALLLLAASCSKSTGLSYDEQPQEISSIQYLKSLCDKSPHSITTNVIIKGHVTANNRYGEFYRSLVLEDASGGITIHADYSHRDRVYYNINDVVTLHCNGLSLIDYGGKVTLGKIHDTENFALTSSELETHAKVEAHRDELRKPLHRKIAELSPRDVDTYLALDNVRFAQPDRKWCDINPETGRPATTEHTLIDDTGNTILVRVLGTCRYAKEPLPEGNGSLCGILDYFNGKYTFRVSAYENTFLVL